jgi:Fumarylacetoacetate (FAA) hydrolase family
VRLCMFHPIDHPMERGWVGRIDGEHVTHLAAQTLQSFFTGGAAAREHAVYSLDGVRLLAPVLHPPSVRVFEHETSFEFANPAAVVGPEFEVASRLGPFTLFPRIASVIGGEGEIAGFSLAADWRVTGALPPKDRDFALGLGPVVVTLDELDVDAQEVSVRLDGVERVRERVPEFDWDAARDFASAGTALSPGDLLVGPPAGSVEGICGGSVVELAQPEIGALRQTVAARG